MKFFFFCSWKADRETVGWGPYTNTIKRYIYIRVTCKHVSISAECSWKKKTKQKVLDKIRNIDHIVNVCVRVTWPIIHLASSICAACYLLLYDLNKTSCRFFFIHSKQRESPMSRRISGKKDHFILCCSVKYGYYRLALPLNRLCIDTKATDSLHLSFSSFWLAGMMWPRPALRQ